MKKVLVLLCLMFWKVKIKEMIFYIIGLKVRGITVIVWIKVIQIVIIIGKTRIVYLKKF